MQELFTKIREKRPNVFDHGITGLVALAGVLVGIETDEGIVVRHGSLLVTLDAIVVWIFVAELIFKLALEGRRPWRYFVHHGVEAGDSKPFKLATIDSWHVFDFSIVVLCVLPYLVPVHVHSTLFPLLRLVRVLRLLRLAEDVPQLQVLVEALLKSLPSIAYICLFMGLYFYVYAAIGSTLFSKSDAEHYGSIAAAVLTLFEIVTGNGFSTLMHDAITRAPQSDYAAWVPVAYYATFVVVAVMVILNLHVGIITAEMSAAKNALADRERDRKESRIEDQEIEPGQLGFHP